MSSFYCSIETKLGLAFGVIVLLLCLVVYVGNANMRMMSANENASASDSMAGTTKLALAKC